MLIEKECRKCGTTQPLENFHRCKPSRDGRYSYCKLCVKATAAARYEANRAEILRKNREWAEANPNKAKAIAQASYLRNKDRVAERSAIARKKNPGKAAEYCAKWRAKNPGAQSRADTAWYAANREKKLSQDKARREAHLDEFLRRERASYAKHRKARSARGKAWRQRNADRVAHHASLRRAMLAQRTPLWLTLADFDAIRRLFSEAKRRESETGEAHHVDHILPLRGRLVSGLHVPGNLQVLPARVNLKKSNLWSPE